MSSNQKTFSGPFKCSHDRQLPSFQSWGSRYRWLGFYLLKIFALISLNATSLWAHEENWVEDYSTSRSFTVMESLFSRGYDWLYTSIIPEKVRSAYPNEAHKSFRVHLKDTNRYFPKPEDLIQQNLKRNTSVRGYLLYVGFIPKKYHYDITYQGPDELTLHVRIHLQKATSEDISNFSKRLQLAENIWNEKAPKFDFKYKFKFELVESARKSHFSVQIVDSTDGPYDTYWSRDWPPTTIAHEVGHMLGLGDEYQTFSGKFDCYRPSLMCAAWTGSPSFHHYYFILRRLIWVQSKRRI